jgi:hypothetical protein
MDFGFEVEKLLIDGLRIATKRQSEKPWGGKRGERRRFGRLDDTDHPALRKTSYFRLVQIK